MFMPFGPDIEIVGVISFLNWVFAFAFPLLPYELFAFMPWAYAVLATRALETPKAQSMLDGLVGFLTLFVAGFAGLVHGAGIIQFVQGALGQPGICGALPPPTEGDSLWCRTMTVHGRIVIFTGWYFLYLVYVNAKKASSITHFTGYGAGDLYGRCALWFTAWGVSLLIPYLGQISLEGPAILAGPGLYTANGWLNRSATRGGSEFLSGVSILCGGVYHYTMYRKAHAPSGSML